MDEVDDLTPTAQDYLKVIWSAVEWGEPPITTKGLAATFATTQANVSDTMRRLDAQGLLIYEPYKPVALTELGQRLAVQMVRRHRLIETFLSEALGYGPDEGHDDAERLEHAVSDKLLGRIDRLLGHPDTDPHGDPIPGDDGGWRPRTDTTRLADAAPGRYRIARIDADPDRIAHLGRLGVPAGSFVRVEGQPPQLYADLAPADAAPFDLTRGDRQAIRVRKMPYMPLRSKGRPPT